MVWDSLTQSRNRMFCTQCNASLCCGGHWWDYIIHIIYHQVGFHVFWITTAFTNYSTNIVNYLQKTFTIILCTLFYFTLLKCCSGIAVNGLWVQFTTRQSCVTTLGKLFMSGFKDRSGLYLRNQKYSYLFTKQNKRNKTLWHWTSNGKTKTKTIHSVLTVRKNTKPK